MNIGRALSGNLSRIKPAALIVIALILGAAMAYVFLVVLEEIRAAIGQPEFEVVDAFYIRPPSLTFQILNTMGAKGRSIYMRIAVTDVLIPACLALLLGGLMAKAWRVTPTPTKHGMELSCFIWSVIASSCTTVWVLVHLQYLTKES